MVTVPGVISTFLLDDEMRKEVEKLEEEATGNVLMGMGTGDNQGMKEVFKKGCVVGFITNEKFVWPDPPNVIMQQNGVTVGFDCTAEEAKKYEKDPNYMVMGTFVLNRRESVAGTGKPVIITPPKPYPEVEKNCKIQNAILGSPSTPSDDYIQEKLGFEKNPNNGTFFLGFDITCDNE
ncbi:MAG: hypothetical protein GX362_01285 [Methanosarcinaceae archaeon]|mgnify:CR=1 FL=1|nr:hypothetical protein [Methanosarcinaceae archaeon]